MADYSVRVVTSPPLRSWITKCLLLRYQAQISNDSGSFPPFSLNIVKSVRNSKSCFAFCCSECDYGNFCGVQVACIGKSELDGNLTRLCRVRSNADLINLWWKSVDDKASRFFIRFHLVTVIVRRFAHFYCRYAVCYRVGDVCLSLKGQLFVTYLLNRI